VGDLNQLPPVKDKVVNWVNWVDEVIYLTYNFRASNKEIKKIIKDFEINKDIDKTMQQLPKFKKEYYDKDIKFIAYKNSTLAKMQEEIIGEIKSGDEVLLFAPLYDSGDKIFDNGDKIKLYKENNDFDFTIFYTYYEKFENYENIIKEFPIIKKELNNDLNLKAFKIKNYENSKYINVIVGDYDEYQELLNTSFELFKRFMKKLTKKYNESVKYIWKLYKNNQLDDLEILYLKTRYRNYMKFKNTPYARHHQFLTTYKAQGKSYNKVCVNFEDMDNTHAYIAISRAREILYKF